MDIENLLNLDVKSLTDSDLVSLEKKITNLSNTLAHQKGIDYNIKDVELINRFEDKLGLISLAMTMAYRGGVNYSDTFGSTMIWDTIIYRELMNRNIILPPNKKRSKIPYEGGYVKEPQVGIHDWVCSFDLNSLYPMTMVQWNMSPETIIPESSPQFNVEDCLSKKVKPETNDYAIAANGSMFRKDQEGIVPSIINMYYDERKAVKKKMLESKQELENIEAELKKRGLKII